MYEVLELVNTYPLVGEWQKTTKLNDDGTEVPAIFKTYEDVVEYYFDSAKGFYNEYLLKVLETYPDGNVKVFVLGEENDLGFGVYKIENIGCENNEEFSK